MKRMIFVLSILLLLTGCALSPNSYRTQKKHISTEQAALPDAVEVSDYTQLRDAILQFIGAGQEKGSIRTVEYDGNVEDDLIQAVYETTRENPIGAFAVDYLNHSSVKIVNYYEITVDITYRKAIYEIDAIAKVTKDEEIQAHVEQALQNFSRRIAMQMRENQTYDIQAILKQYYREHPADLVEVPQIMVMTYPESGPERVVEVEFSYEHSPEELVQMREAMEESVSAAAEYIRYRRSDRDKVLLLHTYLTERFQYVQKNTSTPVYSALCEGIADPNGLAQGFAMICAKAGVECYVVKGLLGSEEHTWNIVSDDGDFRHVDLIGCINERSDLRLMTDWEMSEYYWDMQEYPACVVVEEPVREEPEEEPEEEDPTQPEERPEEEPEEETEEPIEEEPV